VAKEKLCVSPKIQRTWREVAFSMSWRKSVLDFTLTNSVVKVRMHSRVKKEEELVIFGRKHLIKTGKWHKIQQPSINKKERCHY